MELAVIAIVLLILMSVDVPFLVRRQMWRELTVYFLLMAVGIFYALALILGLAPPNPTDLLQAILMPVYEIVAGWLGMKI